MTREKINVNDDHFDFAINLKKEKAGKTFKTTTRLFDQHTWDLISETTTHQTAPQVTESDYGHELADFTL